MGSKVMDEDGNELDATFSVGQDDSGYYLNLESRSGSERSGRLRNSQYDDGLHTLLQRLASLRATLVSVLVDSNSKTVKSLGEAEREVQLPGFPYPIALDQLARREEGIGKLRKLICSGQREIGVKPNAQKRSGAGAWKRIRLNVLIPGFLSDASELLEQTLAADGMTSQEYVESVEKEATPSFSGSVDGRTNRQVRMEQQFLRRLLKLKPGSKPQSCALCGHVYDVQFLVAAHIKQRSECTLEEKLDVEHIVMPACVFGCDALYERGLVYVDPDGFIRARDEALKLKNLAPELRRCADHRCQSFNEHTAPYYAWHRANWPRKKHP